LTEAKVCAAGVQRPSISRDFGWEDVWDMRVSSRDSK
jgi:hypothetical protein